LTISPCQIAPRLIDLLSFALRDISGELQERLADAGYADIRPGHGYVFAVIGPEGARLTELAEGSRITKQAMGELTSDLERLGYLERVPDPTDGRARILRLTDRGAEAQRTGFAILREIEDAWAERHGAERVRDLRAVLAEHAADTRP
jgi:DNA-binding MarR family transcriptional regulator